MDSGATDHCFNKLVNDEVTLYDQVTRYATCDGERKADKRARHRWLGDGIYFPDLQLNIISLSKLIQDYSVDFSDRTKSFKFTRRIKQDERTDVLSALLRNGLWYLTESAEGQGQRVVQPSRDKQEETVYRGPLDCLSKLEFDAETLFMTLRQQDVKDELEEESNTSPNGSSSERSEMRDLVLQTHEVLLHASPAVLLRAVKEGVVDPRLKEEHVHRAWEELQNCFPCRKGKTDFRRKYRILSLPFTVVPGESIHLDIVYVQNGTPIQSLFLTTVRFAAMRSVHRSSRLALSVA